MSIEIEEYVKLTIINPGQIYSNGGKYVQLSFQ